MNTSAEKEIKVVNFSPVKPGRDFDAGRLNRVLNEPEVRKWVLAEGDEALDLSAAVKNPRNVALMSDAGGLFFIAIGPNMYEVHTQFLPSAHGAFALAFAREAVKWMFTRSDCCELITKVPEENKAALGLTRSMKAHYEFTRKAGWKGKDISIFYLDFIRWSQTDPSTRSLGEWFHEKLEIKLAAAGIADSIHPPDSSHDSAVGATIATFRGGQIDKALLLYNRWAAMAGYVPIFLVSRWPLVLDIQTCLVVLNDDLSDFEVRKRG